MTTSLLSDVPVGYFSWAEYDIMAPLQPKTENALAAAFISNCVSRNFRLEALEGLKKANITVDSYGACHGNRDGRGETVQTLLNYAPTLPRHVLQEYSYTFMIINFYRDFVKIVSNLWYLDRHYVFKFGNFPSYGEFLAIYLFTKEKVFEVKFLWPYYRQRFVQ